MIGRNIYFGRGREGYSKPPFSFVINTPVSCDIRKQKLEIEIKQHIIYKNDFRVFLNIIPNKLIIEYIWSFSWNVDSGSDMSHEFSK